MGATELGQVATPLPSTPGLDAVAIADVDWDGCNDIVGAGSYGHGIIHLPTAPAASTAAGTSRNSAIRTPRRPRACRWPWAISLAIAGPRS